MYQIAHRRSRRFQSSIVDCHIGNTCTDTLSSVGHRGGRSRYEPQNIAAVRWRHLRRRTVRSCHRAPRGGIPDASRLATVSRAVLPSAACPMMMRTARASPGSTSSRPVAGSLRQPRGGIPRGGEDGHGRRVKRLLKVTVPLPLPPDGIDARYPSQFECQTHG
jgi:hypothetical protein